MKEIIETAKQITGKEIPVIYEERRTGDPAQLVSDPLLAKEKLEWIPAYNTIDGILKTAWKWHQKSRY